jgi:nucleotide-binding universal stress UspA family protein
MKILLPVDFSEYSKPALERGAALAKRLGAELHVLHVWEFPEPLASVGSAAMERFDSKSFAAAVQAYVQERLDALIEQASALGITIARKLSLPGHPSQVIVDIARDDAYDLIVLGTHGRTGFKRTVLGSVAEKVVRHASCPVLTIRGSAPKGRTLPTRILVPVDYSAASSAALEYATALAKALPAEVEVVHVWDRPSYVSRDVVVHGPRDERKSLSELVREGAERDMGEFLETFHGSADRNEAERSPHRLLAGEPVSTLLAELEREDHDLVVVGTRGRTGLIHLVLGSVAERLVRLSPVAVITVPGKEVGKSALHTAGGDPTLSPGDEGFRPKLQKSRAILAPPALGDHVDRSQS